MPAKALQKPIPQLGWFGYKHLFLLQLSRPCGKVRLAIASSSFKKPISQPTKAYQTSQQLAMCATCAGCTT
eukprot:scaffold229252_cov19-Tisochrysis_lutea.AAC.2